jgi:hypothetical protein
MADLCLTDLVPPLPKPGQGTSIATHEKWEGETMASTQTSKATAANLPQPAAAATASAVAPLTGERDETYNLVSVLYHALQAAESCARYVRDADAHGDDQLAQFFEEVRGSQIELAQQAKQFLAERLDPTDVDEDPPTVG